VQLVESIHLTEACVHRWWSIKAKLFSCLKKRKSFSGQRKGKNPQNDASVLEYFNNLRNKGLPVTREALMSKAKECARNSNVPFKASHGWCEKFMKRESLSLRRRAKINHTLPSEFETKLIEFQHFVIGLRRSNKYPLSQIGNVDEIAAFFSTCLAII
jgi:hypothetical protein